MISFLDAAAVGGRPTSAGSQVFLLWQNCRHPLIQTGVTQPPGSPGGCYPVVRDGAPTSVAQSGASQGRARMRHPPVTREPWPRSVES